MIDIGSTFQQRWQTPQYLIQAGPEAKEGRLAPPVQPRFLPQKREYRRRQSNPDPWDLRVRGLQQSCIL
jgi:hypothetical protein